MKEITEEQLWRWVAGEASETEQHDIREALQHDVSVQKKAGHIRWLHETLQRQARMEEPSASFTFRTMTALREKPLLPGTYGRGLMILAGIVVATGLAALLMGAGTFDSEAVPLTLRQPWLNKLFGSLSLPINVKTVIRAVILGNLALALVLLDRTILRPYFQRRNVSR